MKGGQAGFILGFAQSITFQLVRSMDLLRTFETHGVSLERLAEYRNLETEDIDPLNEPEKDRGDEDVRLASWPGAGRIEATDLSARYAPDMPEILHKVSFSCMGGQRVGIVGATGGGKSTLAKALFRFVDITGGTIKIDDEGKPIPIFFLTTL
jgi:ABC-type multidrug transport system fused ATPase/permease subunit